MGGGRSGEIMFKAWSARARDQQALERTIEAHLNEFADEVVSVAYAVADQHYALIVYRPLETEEEAAGVAVAVAEQIIDEHQG
jgi:hypothetical protein